MLRLVLLATTFFAVSNAQTLLNENEIWSRFTNFQEKFAKKYENVQELETRFSVFRENFRNIITHNADRNQSFTMGVNQFTDLTPEEFKAQMIRGLKAPVGSYGCGTFSNSASGAPSSIDWRTKGAVTTVKDQGQCGSCWTFSSTGAMEGAWAIAKGQLIDLAEQELVDCAGLKYGSMGCNGGQMEGAFKFIIENGQCAASSYPTLLRMALVIVARQLLTQHLARMSNPMTNCL